MPKIDQNIVILLTHEPPRWGCGNVYATTYVQNNGLDDAHKSGAVLTPSIDDRYDWRGKYGYLQALRVVGQYNTDRPEDLYGWEVQYAEHRFIGAYSAEVMFKTLRKVERGMEAVKKQLGYPDSFGEYVARFASVIGCSKFGEECAEMQPDGGFYRWRDAQGMRWRIPELHNPKSKQPA